MVINSFVFAAIAAYVSCADIFSYNRIQLFINFFPIMGKWTNIICDDTEESSDSELSAVFGEIGYEACFFSKDDVTSSNIYLQNEVDLESSRMLSAIVIQGISKIL
nr:PREDICTED: uncharacterized protein LOC105663074 [Megachile rotundata]